MTVYLDVLVGVNTYISWILLYITAAVTHTAVKAKNMALSALIGGLSSLIGLIDLSRIHVRLLYFTAIVLSVVLIFIISYRKSGTKRIISGALIYLTLNILLNGIITVISTPSLISYNGFIYADISLIYLIMATAVIYILIIIISRINEYYISKHRSYMVTITHNGRTYNLIGIADTGNSAHDCITGKPVIICQGIKLYADESSPVTIIPYNTVNSSGILYAVKPENVTITDDKGRAKHVSALCAAIDSNEEIAIFNPTLLS